MTSRFWVLERVLLALFVASGFAGLIYQTIWSHYLGLSLGHAAYAQTLVLAIFMGGMALGAWLVSQQGVRWRRLLLAYAVVEIVIGLAGLAFHPVFKAFIGLSQDAIYPALGSTVAVHAWQWGAAALLIAPQSVLLGMTFPLMSGGYLRVAPKADGEILGGLYFTNSIGAAFGALFATFVLLPWIGMPGAIMVAGAVNVVVGVFAWVVSRRVDGMPAPVAPSPVPAAAGSGNRTGTGDPSFYKAMLLAASITGASSFVYEIGWVRMLNQALGTTIHSFELMLSAFILGLAFGGLWIRRRSHRIVDPVAYVGYAQIFMGIAALVSLPMFAQSFRWVGALMDWLPRTDGGYTLFSIGSAGVALLVMFPAAFFAGMTLPLLTMAILRKGSGESGIGRIYAANTLGAIFGVMLAVHVLIPALGLHFAVTVAAVADIVLGVVLLRRYSKGFQPRFYLAAVAASGLVLCLSALLGRADPQSLASGVFRTGLATLSETARIGFLRDGKTATVAVYEDGGAATIATNGKPDAAMQLDLATPPTNDEVTMLMVGAIPLASHPDPRRVAVIGWGSGLSTHTLLGSATPESVDSIEIERSMYDGATLFGERVRRAYTDPRSHLRIDDARTYFSTGRQQYDIIVSEPSNPWVSGVASLFTRQFYQFLSAHLEDDGVLVQWIQTYEINDKLLATMLAALATEFPHVDVYRPNSGDLVLVASRNPLRSLTYPVGAGDELRSELARVGLSTKDDFAMYRVGSIQMVDAIVRLSGMPAHDDFRPTVSLQAPRARFRGDSANWIGTLLQAGLPVLEMTGGWKPPAASAPVTLDRDDGLVRLVVRARHVSAAVRTGQANEVSLDNPTLAAQISVLRSLSAIPVAQEELSNWMAAVTNVAEHSLAQHASADLSGLWIDPVWFVAGGQPPEVLAVMEAYEAAARRDAGAMRVKGQEALSLLSPDMPFEVREHMLVIALLGASSAGDFGAVTEIERSLGRLAPALPGSRYGFIRSYLLAWSDQKPEIDG